MVQEERKLREYLLQNYYVCKNGLLKRSKTFGKWEAHKEVGTIGLRGYKTLSIRGKRYYIHRLIFLMEFGYLPELVDHIDGNKLNNIPSNLRESSKVLNALNLFKSHEDNKTKLLGVTYRKDTGKYSARFRNKSLGCFDTPEEAHNVYLDFKANEGASA